MHGPPERLHARWRKLRSRMIPGRSRVSVQMRMRAALFFLPLAVCTRWEPAPRSAASAIPPGATAPASGATPSAPGDEIFEGTIVGEGPIGDGMCVQKSYEVESTGAARTRVWIHFERCGDAGPSPAVGGLDALGVGATYRFTVRRGASKNFGTDPILLAAETR